MIKVYDCTKLATGKAFGKPCVNEPEEKTHELKKDFSEPTGWFPYRIAPAPA
jgi:hypothetical protein